MTELLTLPAALLMGLAASGHCMVMCGGVAGAMSIATVVGPRGRGPDRRLLLASQLGRISSYALAGAAVGGLSAGVLALLGSETARVALRLLSALGLLLAAAVMAGWIRDPGLGFGARIWRRIAPWGRRWLPITNARRAFAFGMVWGWMPCGFVYSVLVVAALSGDALMSAATMIAFGLGTLPAMLATAAGAPWLQRLFRGVLKGSGPRQAVGAILVVFALATALVPLLMMHGHDHGPGPASEGPRSQRTHSGASPAHQH